MYWRDVYPTHEAAARAGRLGDLGKVKLTTAQKAAVAQAKADAKVSKIAAKSSVTNAKLALKTAKVANKQAISIAKTGAKVAVYDAKTAVAKAPAADSSAFAANMTALQNALPGSGDAQASFAPSGGGGGMAPYQPSQDAAPSDSIFDTIPIWAWVAGAGALGLLLFKKH